MISAFTDLPVGDSAHTLRVWLQDGEFHYEMFREDGTHFVPAPRTIEDAVQTAFPDGDNRSHFHLVAILAAMAAGWVARITAKIPPLARHYQTTNQPTNQPTNHVIPTR